MDLRKLALVGAIALAAACQHKQTKVAEAPDTTAGGATDGSTGTTTTPDDSVAEGGTPEADGTAQPSGETDAYGQTGTGTGTSSDPGTMGGTGSTSGQAHSDDRVIVGTVKKFSQRSIDIQDATTGQAKTLQIAPETLIEAGGSAQLMEGQQVRASYNRVGGKDTAVRIEAMSGTGAGTAPHGTGSSTDPGGTGSGTMGEPADPGTSTTPGTGTDTGAGSPTDPTAPPGSTTTPMPTQPSPPIQSPPSGGTGDR